jgi:hypothetical protein
MTNRLQKCLQISGNDTSFWEGILTSFTFAFSWLARQFIHFDANFRLVLEKRAQQSFKDPGLWERTGFFVASDPYAKYLAKMDSVQQPVCHCSSYLNTGLLYS